MMKNLRYTRFAVLLLLLAAGSCGKDKTTTGEGITGASWTAAETAVADGEQKTYHFMSAANWTAQSDEPAWCEVTTPSGDKGQSTLKITVDKNETASTRSANISIKISGFGTAGEFTITQAASGSGGSGADRELNKRVDDFLAKYYLWNGEYSQMTRDLSLDYVSTNDNFMSRTLMSMTTNDLDKKQNSSGGYSLYSYLLRTPAGRSIAQTTRGVNHGLTKEKENSLGIVNMFAVEFSNKPGYYGLGILAVYPESPVAKAGFMRGTIFVQVNGKDITAANLNSVYAQLVAPGGGQTLTVTENAKGAEPVSLTAEEIYPNPVLYSEIIDGKIGYLVYSSFDAAYDDDLLGAIAKFKDAGITDMILDLRINGGGHVITANMLSTCIAGSKCENAVYQYYRYNDDRMKKPSQTAQETGHPYDTQQKRFREDFRYGNYYGVDLRNYALNLGRLYVIVTNNTASSSEAVINSLRGIDGFTVTLVGEKTNGKNVGMEVSKFTLGSYQYELTPITFQGYNAKMVTVDPKGLSVDKQISEWDYAFKDFSDRSEPLVAWALSQITGTSYAAYVGTNTRAATNIRPATVSLPDLSTRPKGMIALLPESGE